jgi:hypothetical protein
MHLVSREIAGSLAWSSSGRQLAGVFVEGTAKPPFAKTVVGLIDL